MPKVPRNQENQRLNPQNPTGFQSTSQARLMGDAVSSFGRGLASFGQGMMKVKNANATLARKDAQNQTNDVLGKIYKQQEREGFRADREAFYGEEKKKGLAEVKKKLIAKYGDTYTNDIEVFSNTVEESWDERVGSLDNKQFVAHTAKVAKEVEAQYTAKVYESPGLLEDVILDASQMYDETGNALGLNNEQKDAKIKSITKGLVETAIDGHMISEDNIGYLQAKTLVAKTYSDLYTQEERKKKLDDLKREYRGNITHNNSQIDRQERLVEAETARSREMRTTQLVSDVEKAVASGSAAGIREARAKAVNYMSKGDLTFKNFNNFLTPATKGYKELDAVSKFNVRALVYDGSTDKDFVKGRAEVMRLRDSGQMLPETAANLIKEFDAMQRAFDSDPIFKQKDKAAKAYMNKILGDETAIQQLMVKYDNKSNREKLARIQGAKQKYHQMIASAASSGRKVDPMVMALTAVDTVDFTSVVFQAPGGQAPAFTPKYSKEGTNIDIRDIQEYEQTIIRYLDTPQGRMENDIAKAEIKGHLSRLRLVREQLGLYGEMTRNVDELRKATTNEIINNYETNNPTDSADIDMESLLQDDEDGVPFMLRTIRQEL